MSDIISKTLEDMDLPGDWRKILIPTIRKILPGMIAADIVGIQPMTGPSGSIFSMKNKYGLSAQEISSYDDWLERNNLNDCNESVDRYVEELEE